MNRPREGRVLLYSLVLLAHYNRIAMKYAKPPIQPIRFNGKGQLISSRYGHEAAILPAIRQLALYTQRATWSPEKEDEHLEALLERYLRHEPEETLHALFLVHKEYTGQDTVSPEDLVGAAYNYFIEALLAQSGKFVHLGNHVWDVRQPRRRKEGG